MAKIAEKKHFHVSARFGLPEQSDLGRGLKNQPGKLQRDWTARDLRKDGEMISPRVYTSKGGGNPVVTNSSLSYLLPGDMYFYSKG